MNTNYDHTFVVKQTNLAMIHFKVKAMTVLVWTAYTLFCGLLTATTVVNIQEVVTEGVDLTNLLDYGLVIVFGYLGFRILIRWVERDREKVIETLERALDRERELNSDLQQKINGKPKE